MTQPAPKVRELLRADNASNPDSLTIASQVVVIHFQTVVEANHYWNESSNHQKHHQKARVNAIKLA